MKTLTVAVLIVGLVTGGGVRAQGLSPSDIFEKAAPTIVTVHAADASGAEIMQGSGVVIRPGVVVSNCHVIKSATTVQVGVIEQRLHASVLHADPDRDLCSLSVPTLNAPAAQIGDSVALAIGSKVYAIGAPRGLTLTLTDGLLSAKRGGLLQVSAPVSPGSSGGGLFNARGELVGITTLHLKESQQLNFAVPGEWIAELPTRNGGARSIASRHDAATAVDAASAPILQAYEEGKSQAALANQQLNEWEEKVAPRDYNYAILRPALVEQVVSIKQRFSPKEWLWETQKAYDALTASTSTVYRCIGRSGQSYSNRHVAGQECTPVTSYTSNQRTRWLSIGDAEGTAVEIDSRTLSRSSLYGGAWVRFTEPSGEIALAYYSVHCPSTRFRLTDSAFVTASGRVESSGIVDDDNWERALPNSVAETIVSKICM